ncbi:hypothetical protein TNIN_213281 [Trichonephila inaurata madagascariensis]|uniref:Uncharacterized protein n=1 Tax=Trichonephila inaurata madagascariensis TaxID=2747483 RepID=A0A8X7BZJ4_9ARAC|nr:hypothetical protein TNIN_213281 [Trichonephila inaurata madagascariensis]
MSLVGDKNFCLSTSQRLKVPSSDTNPTNSFRPRQKEPRDVAWPYIKWETSTIESGIDFARKKGYNGKRE